MALMIDGEKGRPVLPRCPMAASSAEIFRSERRSPVLVRISFRQMLEQLREGLPIGQALALAVANEAFRVGDRQTHGEVLHRVVRSALTPGAGRRGLAGGNAAPPGRVVDHP